MFEMFRRSGRRRAVVNWLTVSSPALLCALFFVAGLAVLDDYGMSLDEDWQRVIGASAVDYVLGNDYAPRRYTDWYYGVAFEAPLLLLERILGLEDTRAIYLSRHLLTHLFFIGGGFFLLFAGLSDVQPATAGAFGHAFVFAASPPLRPFFF